MAIDFQILSADNNGEMDVLINGIIYRYYVSYVFARELILELSRAKSVGQKMKVFEKIRGIKRYVKLTQKKEET